MKRKEKVVSNKASFTTTKLMANINARMMESRITLADLESEPVKLKYEKETYQPRLRFRPTTVEDERLRAFSSSHPRCKKRSRVRRQTMSCSCSGSIMDISVSTSRDNGDLSLVRVCDMLKKIEVECDKTKKKV